MNRQPAAAIVCASLVLTVSCGGGRGDSELCEQPVYEPPVPFVPEGIPDVARWVDPLIGTRGSGNVVPGALVPHGMVRLTPDTLSGGGRVGVYHGEDERMEGFVHTALEGPGGSANGYGQLLVTAGVGARDPEDATSAYSHDDEDAEPGYYRVTLTDHDVDVELTATAHAAIHRYTFPAREDGWLIVDLGHSKGRSTGGRIEVVGDHTVRGAGHYEMHPTLSLVIGPATPTSQTKLYFHAELDHPFESFGTWDDDGAHPGERELEGKHLGAWMDIDASDRQVVEVRVGVSFVSIEQARRNLEEEIGAATFEQVREEARRQWNDRLGRVVIEGDDHVKRTFYTALYRTMMQPANHAEAGGCFTVMTGGLPVTHGWGGRPWYTDDWCMWDTYRTHHLLGSLTEPEIRADVVRSMLVMYEEGGWLPKCTWHAAGYSRVMIGNPQVAVIGDAWLKGLDDFDRERAWEAMRKTSEQEVDISLSSICGYLGLGTPEEYVESGWVSHECDGTQAASMTLEIAHADHCMAEVAALTGRTDDETRYRARSGNWRNQWNPDNGFMQSRHRDGTWVEPFDPADGSEFNGFCEATPWIYTFSVPHDVPGLVSAAGGPEAFADMLDAYFEGGHHDAGNQPGFHVPWLYNWAGRPSSTQARVRALLDEHFSDGPDGLPGNDDAGAMSAWYVLAALGLYPVAACSTVLQISTPLVESATLHLHPAHHEGETFTIETEGAPGDMYIQSATLDGTTLERPWIRWDEITGGGTLHLVLGPDPSDWGASTPPP